MNRDNLIYSITYSFSDVIGLVCKKNFENKTWTNNDTQKFINDATNIRDKLIGEVIHYGPDETV